MDWLEANQIAIMGQTDKKDSFGIPFVEVQLSIPCKGKDKQREFAIVTAIKNTLNELGCETSNVNALLGSFNFRDEFVKRETEYRDIVVTHVYVCVSVRDADSFDERLSTSILLKDYLWNIFNKECLIYKR